MPTVLSPEFKQVSLPHATSEKETGLMRGKDEKPTPAEAKARNVSSEATVVRFDPETRTAEVSQEVADELVRLFPQSVVVVPDGTAPEPAKEPDPAPEAE